MKQRRTALLLAVIIAVTAVMSAIPCIDASAATAAEVRYFLDTVGPMCTNDMRDNHILASFSMAQAIWESGWGTSTLAKQANNLFGMRAYSTWGGKVFDRNECVTYASYAELKAIKGDAYVKEYELSFWRAYDSWQESVNDHSALFNGSSRYVALRGNYDYKSCAIEVEKAGYCSGQTYVDKMIMLVENYDLSKYNYDFDGTGNTDNTVIALSPSNIYMDTGASYNLKLTVKPEGTAYTISSSNTAVATVSGTTLTAVSDGEAKITLTAGDVSVSSTVTVKSGYGCIVADGVYVKCLATGDTATVPTTATAISEGAFADTAVKNIVVGVSVESIADGAFSGINGGFTLCTYGNSTVQSYAQQYNISCVNLAGWMLDKNAALLTGVRVYTTASVVSLYYDISGSTATVTDADGNPLSDTAYVGTGCKVTVNGKTYVATIKGDTTGDGKTSTADLVALKTYLGGTDKALPERAYRRAADYNGDNRITTADYLAIFKES